MEQPLEKFNYDEIPEEDQGKTVAKYWSGNNWHLNEFSHLDLHIVLSKIVQ